MRTGQFPIIGLEIVFISRKQKAGYKSRNYIYEVEKQCCTIGTHVTISWIESVPQLIDDY